MLIKCGWKSESAAKLGEQIGVSMNQIRRFIRLTYLIEPLQEMVDGRHENEIKIAFNSAVELSYLTESEQYDLANAIIENQRTPSLAQCQEFKRLSHDGELTSEFIEDTLSEEKPNQREKLSFQMKEIDKYFPKDFTPGKKKDLMIHLLENWQRKDHENKNGSCICNCFFSTCDCFQTVGGAVCLCAKTCDCHLP